MANLCFFSYNLLFIFLARFFSLFVSRFHFFHRHRNRIANLLLLLSIHVLLLFVTLYFYCICPLLAVRLLSFASVYFETCYLTRFLDILRLLRFFFLCNSNFSSSTMLLPSQLFPLFFLSFVSQKSQWRLEIESSFRN